MKCFGNVKCAGIKKREIREYNMKKLLIVGAGGFGRVTLEHAQAEFECAFVDDTVPVGERVCGAEVVGTTDDIGRLRDRFENLTVAIGNNAAREKFLKIAENAGYALPNVIARSAYLSPFAKVGRGCVILNNAVIQNGAIVGDGVLINPGVEAHQDSVVGSYSLIYTNSVVRTFATVGERAKIGSNATVATGAVVPADGVVGDGETVTN